MQTHSHCFNTMMGDVLLLSQRIFIRCRNLKHWLLMCVLYIHLILYPMCLVCSCNHLHMHPSAQPSIHSTIQPFTHLSVHPFISIHLFHFTFTYSIHPCIHPFIHSSNDLYHSIHPSIHTSIHPNILSSIHPLIYPSTHPYIHLFINLNPSIHLPSSFSSIVHLQSPSTRRTARRSSPRPSGSRRCAATSARPAWTSRWTTATGGAPPPP